ncbi:AraC family transcriptional regulator [Pedobacter steynii]|uniref:AraC family transcriptional regulator n=1 Tax=Pedobacter steynii TaxID=430522 RepID=A0A1D7QQ58_9SPHI|nr:AraC family transcriptional regulator [Pedobacter steynii]
MPIRHFAASQTEQDFSLNFGIRSIVNLLAGKDMVQELHRHDFFYILVLEKGAGHHEIDFSPYPVSDHAVFFMRPGQVHQLLLKAESRGYLIHFNEAFYALHDKNSNQLLAKVSHVNHYQLTAERFQKILMILTDAFQEYSNKQERYQEVIKANMKILFIELFRQHQGKALTPVNLYMQEMLEKFLTLLEIHVFEHKQVSQYAELLNLSTYQLNTIAKTMLGKTCSKLIDEYMILEAKRCLLATSGQVNQIAYHLGYEDVSYFIRFFKKHTGFSPESFRQNFS